MTDLSPVDQVIGQQPTRMTKWDVIQLSIVIICGWIIHPVWAAPTWQLGLDQSWQLTLHHAFASGWQFGKDIVFTYGPLGFVAAHRYHPKTFAISIVINMAITAITVCMFWRMVASRLTVARGWLAVLVILTLLVVAYGHVDSLAFFSLFLPVIWRWTSDVDRDTRFDRVLLHAVMLQLAALALVKHTYAAGVVLVGIALLVEHFSRRKGLPWFAATAIFGMLGVWLLASQSISAIGDYIRNTSQIVLGYGPAMAYHAPVWHAVVYWFICIGLGAAVALILRRSIGRWTAAPVLFFMLLLFLLGKAWYVRQGAGHMAMACGVIPTLGSLLVIIGWTPLPTRPQRVFLLLLLASCFAFGWSPYQPSPMWRAVTLVPFRASACVTALFTAEKQQLLTESKEEIRNRVPLPNWTESVDLFPHFQSLLLAHGLNYSPRPVIQSYSAYTPELLKLNREHFVGSSAPKHVVFTLGTIDERMLTCDDSLTWPILLTNYRVIGQSEPFYLLQRDKSGRRWHQSLLAEGQVELGNPMAVPAVEPGEVVWAQIEVKHTLTGKLVSSAYRPPRLWIKVRLSDGRIAKRRFVPGVGEAGFILSPFLTEPDDFLRLSQTIEGTFWTGQAVTDVGIEVSDEIIGESAYQSTVTCRLYRCSWDRQKRSDNGKENERGQP